MNSIPCVCGRSWTHCKVCGSKNIYRLITESEIESAREARQVDVWRCKKCMSSSTELDTCQAARPKERSKIVTEESFIQANETPAQYASRLLKEGKTPEQVRSALALIGVKVYLDSDKKPDPVPEPLPAPVEVEIPISIEDILSASKKNKEIL